jgi:tRNA (uracil-5-)-methyltransferase TRM9
MQPVTIDTLLDLNDRFYRDFGAAFASTRRKLQVGVLRAVDELLPPGSGEVRWLDLGCGTGELARALADRGCHGRYLGLDASLQLLEETPRLAPSPDFSAVFQATDLSSPGWVEELTGQEWTEVSLFAVLHHLPGVELRARVLQQARLLLEERGKLVLSVWQFENSPRLSQRRQPWSLAGLSDEQVEPGDALLDWRHALPGQAERVGLRYVHLFTPAELTELAQACGFEVLAQYASDGAGGKLGLYQIWRAG